MTLQSTIPELKHGENSWICTIVPYGIPCHPVELYHRPNVEKLAARGWTIQTAGDYLAGLNARIQKDKQK